MAGNDTMDRSDAEATLLAIDTELDKRFMFGFAPPLEAKFEEETSGPRVRMLVKLVLVSLVLFDGLLAVDYAVLPDVFGLAAILRLGLFTSINVVAIWLLARGPVPWARESMVGALAILGAGIIFVLATTSQSPLREDYHYGILFLILFALSAQRLRFRYALPTAVIMLGIHALAVFNIPEIIMPAKMAVMALTQGITSFVLISAYSLEDQERRIWLRALRDRLRATQFEELAAIDPLTGLGNRRAMQQWVAMRKGKVPGGVSLIMADIDLFKSYNDAFGHLAGDDCLRRVAATLVAQARGPNDAVFRFGGEEFIVVLVGTEHEVARAVAERMRRAVADARIPHKSRVGFGYVTASFGVATVEDGLMLDLDALIAEADGQLYAAKRGGRNQIAPPLISLAPAVNG